MTKVSTGELPAETAINMLVDFFQLDIASAKRMVLPAKENHEKTLIPD